MPKQPSDSSSTPANITDRLPPGQQLVAPGKWPIVGEREPPAELYPPTLTITELHQRENESDTVLSLDDLSSFKQTSMVIDIHCVTRWSKLDVEFSGVLLSDLLKSVGVSADAKFVSFVSCSDRKHSSSISLATALELETLIALKVDGQPIPDIHGGPIRNIVPGRYFYKSVKWLAELKMLNQDELGCWEQDAGYHNLADPWKEQRYMAANIDRRTAGKLIQSRDFSERDLRSIDVSNMELAGLNAKSALLRDANFQHAKLASADFSKANLSNAHFQFADLTNCKFVEADLEGANLSGANLAGADLTGCSLIGASFCELDTDGKVLHPCEVDSQTVIPKDLLGVLVPAQSQFLIDTMNEHQ